jgi:hypothetical protein
MNKQRIRRNVVTTAANVTYYGGTIGAGLGFHHLFNNPGALGIAVVIVVVLTVEGLLRTFLEELLNVATTEQDQNAPAASLAKTD